MTDNVSDATQKVLQTIQERLSGIDGRLDKMHAGQVELLETIKEVAKGVNNLYELTRLHGGRLNTIDARLARLEGEAGFVKV